MTGVALESVSAIVLLGLILYLSHIGRNQAFAVRHGWRWIIGGFGLLFLGTVLDITDNFDALGRFVVVGDTQAKDFLETIVCFLGGVVAIAVGLAQWLPEELAQRKRSAELVTTVIENMSEGFLYFDADDRLVLINEKIAEFYPLAADVFVLGTSYETCLRVGVERGQWGPPAGQDKEAWIRERLAYHYDPEGTYEFNLPDGRCIRIEERKTPEGGIVGVRTDITNLKVAEKEIAAKRDELANLNEQKDKFFAIIAHDLKSPFTVLLGVSQFLSTNAKTMERDQIGQYGTMVHRAADQAFKLLEDLLDWSRLQLDRMEFEVEPLDVKKVVDASLERFEPAATAKNIVIKSDTARQLRVQADAHMLDTILRNLLNNAIKFTPEQGTVTITADRQNGFGVIEVADTGVGMAADTVAGLFSLDQTTTTKGTEGETGTGLGLHLCKELIEKLGGEIRVESAESKGSSFRISLPLARD